MALKFRYPEHGMTALGTRIYGVTIDEGNSRRVLGFVQEDPTAPNKWRAVAATDGAYYPAFDYDNGLWAVEPGRGEFGSKREAAVWLLGASDARQTWFKES